MAEQPLQSVSEGRNLFSMLWKTEALLAIELQAIAAGNKSHVTQAAIKL